MLTRTLTAGRSFVLFAACSIVVGVGGAGLVGETRAAEAAGADARGPAYILRAEDTIMVTLFAGSGTTGLPPVRLSERTNIVGKSVEEAQAQLLELFKNSPWPADRVEILVRPDARTAPASAANAIRIYDPSQLDQQPVARSRTPATYPVAMRRAKITGEVIVDFIVDDKGNTQSVYALSSTQSDFEAAAVAAVEKWKFNPGKREGKAVHTSMRVPILFTLNDR